MKHTLILFPSWCVSSIHITLLSWLLWLCSNGNLLWIFFSWFYECMQLTFFCACLVHNCSALRVVHPLLPFLLLRGFICFQYSCWFYNWCINHESHKTTAGYSSLFLLYIFCHQRVWYPAWTFIHVIHLGIGIYNCCHPSFFFLVFLCGCGWFLFCMCFPTSVMI